MNQSLMDIVINWFPMLLLIGVWVFFLRRMGGARGYTTQHQRELMDEMKRQVQVLERIAAALEKNTGP